MLIIPMWAMIMQTFLGTAVLDSWLSEGRLILLCIAMASIGLNCGMLLCQSAFTKVTTKLPLFVE